MYVYEVHNREKGFFAEDISAQYLSKKGYRVLFKNWTCKWGELDLVTEKGGILTFIEVKCRLTDIYGEVSESLTYSKKKHLWRTINVFLKQETVFRQEEGWHFDLICITKSCGEFLINHYRNLSLT